MTRSEFESTMAERIDTLRTLEQRMAQARRLGLRVTGWVLTREEHQALGYQPILSQKLWVCGKPIYRVIEERYGA